MENLAPVSDPKDIPTFDQIVNEVVVSTSQPADGPELWVDTDATARDTYGELDELRARVEALERMVNS